MSRSRVALGRQGEETAARFLSAKGYRLEARNVRLKGGEIDIVAWDDETLVFVEVRTRRGRAYGSPLESVDHRKRQRLRLLARRYFYEHRVEHVMGRFDVIGIHWTQPGRPPEIHHIQNAFSL